ncbi:TonB-dependent receptor [Alkalicaulis satelles]|uniref:TonB-dependent receptor n=1 Tax=Alkalicaulis satelles TaxID=2609175 RepID=A0A5M6ZFQ6_9PROT|nr:TonB-dependent receptor [Alkalicaulis satelles]KAA5803559.1 TonB-dependent receptor [Alkalicaulis satelles]
MKLNLVLLGSASVMALAGLSGAASAQHAVSGLVTDANGAPLPGAQVRVRELGLTTSTNRQGQFTFLSVPSGETRIEVNYLGLPTAELALDVQPVERNFITFTLAADAADRIVITGSILDGQARALNQQRTNRATTNIVSADAIGRFPDENIAEALQRVPGFGIERDQGEGRYVNLRGAPAEFTQISVDGVSIAAVDPGTRAVDLDTIPSDVVNAIEVSKTLLPNQDADSIAGAVNLVTRSPFDRRGFRLNAQGGISYNEYGGTNDRRASFVVSNTFGENETMGALFSASYSQTDRRVDNFESIWDLVTRPEGDEIFAVVETEIKDYDTRRERMAFTGALEFRPDDQTTFFLRGTASRFEDDELRNLLYIEYEAGSLQPGATNTTATWANARLEKELRRRIVRNDVFTLAAGGEHDFGTVELDYSLSFNRSEQTYPQRNQLNYRSTIRPTISYDYTNRDLPFVSLFETGEHLNLAAFGFRENTFRGTDTVMDEWSGRVNLSGDGALFGTRARHQAGLSFRLRDGSSDEFRFRDRRGSTAALTPALADIISNRPSQNFDYNLGFKIDDQLAQAYWRSVANISTEDAVLRVPQSVEADYSVEENIYGAYAMTELDYGATTVIAGLRVEHTDFSSTAFRLNTTTETATPVSNSRDYTNWFPNLTVRHEFSDNLIGRAALTRAIARPNYPDVVARISVGDTPPLTVNRGNPELRPTLSNNFDAGLEYYLRPLGLLAVNVFYKDLENYEFTLRTPGEFEGEQATFIQAENAPDGFIRGLELTWQQTFDFLPGMLGNIGVFGNYTWTDSEMNIGRTIGGRSVFPLPGHSDYAYNLAVFYETDRFNARLSYNNRGDYLNALDAEDGRKDLYWEGREQLDFTASFDVTDRLGVFFEAKNLTDTPGVRYFGDRSRVYEYEKFGYTMFFGLRFNY